MNVFTCVALVSGKICVKNILFLVIQIVYFKTGFDKKINSIFVCFNLFSRCCSLLVIEFVSIYLISINQFQGSVTI